ncbi:MAG: hypothetical protein VX100_08700 [Pseudomonadota bacterium]|nr:hypothetical protein [Pseudomonadota bacterium]
MLLLKITGIWLLMVVAAIVNGTLRELFLNKYLLPEIALPLSGLILSVLIIVISLKLLVFIKGESSTTYLCVGIFWVTLTLLLEYGLGFSQGLTLSEINEVFSVHQGNLFSLVLLVTLFSPIVVARLNGYSVDNKQQTTNNKQQITNNK